MGNMLPRRDATVCNYYSVTPQRKISLDLLMSVYRMYSQAQHPFGKNSQPVPESESELKALNLLLDKQRAKSPWVYLLMLL